MNIEKAEAAKIRVKLKWIEEGKKCTNFFLGLEKFKATSNTVFKIKNNYGNEITDENEIVEEFGSFFQKVYSDCIDDNEIDNNLNTFFK